MTPSKSNSESPSKGPGEKPELTKERLEENNVSYSKDIHDPAKNGNIFAQLPPHIEYVRESLLNFRNSLPKFDERYHELLRRDVKDLGERMEDTERRMTHDWSLAPPDKSSEQSAWWEPTSSYPLRNQDQTNDQLKKDFYDSQETAIECKKRHSKLEPDWTPWLNRNIFKEYDEALFESSQGPQSNTGVPARHEMEIFEKWCIARDFKWNENLLEDTNSTHRQLTGPKPDVTYAFPIFESLCYGFSHHECGASFSLSTLHQLRKDPSIQLVSTPTTGLSRVTQTSEGLIRKAPYGLSDSDLMCFPWAVVEFKHARVNQSEMNKCYLQAANSSATALRMLGALFRKAAGSVPEDLPPVIAFTCIGPAVQVWLTYRAGPTRENGDKMRIHMQCIYATHLELLWGVHSCRLVIKHMHVWASRILKPRIWVCLSSLVSKTSLANGAAIGLPQESCNDEQVQSGVQSADEPSPSLKTPSKESRAKLPVRSPRIPKASGTACPLSSSPRKSAPYTPNLPKTGGAEEAAITPPESPERPETPECRPTGASTSKSPFISGPTFPERKPYLFGGSTSAEGRSGLFGMFHKAQKSEQSQPFSAGFNGKKEKNVSAAEVEDLVFGFGTFGLHSKSSDTSNKKTHTRSSDAADLEGDQQAPDAQTYRYHTYRTGQPREIFVEEELDVDDGEWMPQHYLSRSCSSDETSDFSDDGSDEDSESDFDCDSEDQDGVCSAPKSKSAFGSVFDINPGSREKPDSNHPKDSDYASSTRLGSHPSSGDGLRDGKDALGGNSQFDRPANSDTTSSTSHHCGEELKEEEEKSKWGRLALCNMPSREVVSLTAFRALLDVQSCEQLANACIRLYLYFTSFGSGRFPDTFTEDITAGLSSGGWGPMSVQEFFKDATAPSVALYGFRLLREHGDKIRLQRLCTVLVEAMPTQRCVEAMLCAGFDEHGKAWADMGSVALWQVDSGAQHDRKLPSMSWEEGTCLDWARFASTPRGSRVLLRGFR